VLAVENGVTERATVTIPAAAPVVASAVASNPTPSHLAGSAARAAHTLQLSADDRPVDIGSGNNHLVGGSELGLLSAGSAGDALSGSMNGDYLSASSGNDTLSGGAGANFMQAGSGLGSTMFDLHQADAGKDIMSGVRLGHDYPPVTDLTGAALAGSGVTAPIGGASGDARGSAMVSEHHDVTLSVVGMTKLGSGIFG
jgi:Ca2+-binding RTX toxin-like protein